jgi:type II secretory pathway component PulK
MPNNSNSRSGSALLVVLIFLGAVAILAAVVARSVSSAALELSSARSDAQIESDLRAGIELGVAAILNLEDGMRRANAAADLSNRRLTVLVTNERARIDINRAKVDVLTALLKSIDLDQTEAASLAANVVAWRGGDRKEPSGPMQTDQHFGAPSQSLASNSTLGLGSTSPSGLAGKQPSTQTATIRFFSHPFQLVMVPGFSLEIVRRLFPLVTVANGANTINPFIAARGVLSALPGVSSSDVDAFVGARDTNVSRETAMLMLGAEKEMLSEGRAGGWRLQITSKPRVGPTRHSEVVIAGVDGSSSDEPYRVLYVIDDADQQAWQVR